MLTTRISNLRNLSELTIGRKRTQKNGLETETYACLWLQSVLLDAVKDSC